MSDDKITVDLQERETIGKGLGRLREQGQVPGVVHNHGKPSLHVVGDFVALNKVYARAGKRHPVYLTIGGKNKLAIIKDADFEPTKHLLRHVVFQSLRQNEKVTADIPVVLTGEEIPAEIAGHMVLPQLDAVQVEALPNDLPDKFEVDATGLAEVGDRLSVADLKAPAGVTILTESEQSLAVVEMPRDQVAEANAAAEEMAKEAAAGEEEGEGEAAEGEEKEEGEESAEKEGEAASSESEGSKKE